MRQVTTATIASPAATLDPKVVEFRPQFDKTSPLDELVRSGAQRMLQTAIEAEVEEFIAVHGDRIARGTDGGLEIAKNGVVLEQVRERRGVGQVVDRHDLHRGVVHGRPEHQPSDPPEPVDPYPYGHCRPLPIAARPNGRCGCADTL